MTTKSARQTPTTPPQEIEPLDRKLGISKYRSAGMGHDGQMFTCTLTLDGRAVADVIQEGHGGDNAYDFKDRQLEKELHDWAGALTGSKYGGLDLVVEHLIGMTELNRQARKWAKQGDAAALLILAEPQFFGDEKEANPYSTHFATSIMVPLRRREDAAEVAAGHNAVYYAVSDELPADTIADPEEHDKKELLKQAKKWNATDPTIRAAVLIRKTKDGKGTVYAVRTEDDIKRRIQEVGTAFYLVSDFLPEPTAEQIRAAKVKKCNKQLETWRKTDKRIVAAVIYQTAQGSMITATQSREHGHVLQLIKRNGATGEDYIISDALPGVADNPNAAAVSQLRDHTSAPKKDAGKKAKRR